MANGKQECPSADGKERDREAPGRETEPFRKLSRVGMIGCTDDPVEFGLMPTVTKEAEAMPHDVPSASAQSANDMRFRLTAPNGATVFPFSLMIGASIGPLTMDDETPVQTCADPNPPCFDPDRTLGPPYAGTASTGDLFRLDGGPMRGTWMLRVVDLFPMETSTLVFWRLNVMPERPAR